MHDPLPLELTMDLTIAGYHNDLTDKFTVDTFFLLFLIYGVGMRIAIIVFIFEITVSKKRIERRRAELMAMKTRTTVARP